MVKSAAAANSMAKTAAVAANAVRMSYNQSKLAHQNAALQARVYADFERHMTLLGRAQYVAKGEAVYATDAVMRTLTTKAAVSIETATYNAAVKTATTALSGTSTSSAATSAASAGAKAAALAAATKTPVGRTAPRPPERGALCNPSHAGWFGDPNGNDCVAAAIASSAWLSGVSVSFLQYQELARALGVAPSIEAALVTCKDRLAADGGLRAKLLAFDTVTLAERGCVIGFRTPLGPHAALYLGDGIIASWGEELLIDEVMVGDVEEAWELTWEIENSQDKE